MAKKMRKFLAWVMALTLIAGQMAIPAAADEAEDLAVIAEVVVDDAPSVPKTPAASSQAPAESGSVSVSTSESSATSSSGGVTEESSSTTTSWSGSEGGTSTSGSETTTTVTGTDDVTGQTLYEGGTTSGSETSVTTSDPATESVTEEGYVTKEVNTSSENTTTETSETSITETSSSTETGSWSNTENGYTEGQFEADKTVNKETTTITETLGEEEIPEEDITIDLTLDNDKSDPENGSYTFTGTASSEIIPLTEGVTIPEGAIVEKDADGNIIGYRLETTTTTITDTQTKEGEEKLDQANSSTDTTGSTAAVTPDLDTAAKNLGIHIDNNTQIDEETNDNGDVVAYVITNTTEEDRQISAIGELTRPEAGSFPQEDGTILTRTIEDSLDADGNAVVTIVEVQTDANGKELSRNKTTQTIIENSLPEAAKPVTNYILPTRPDPSTKTEDSITTTVTVTDILDADGEIIGYKSTTVKTDANGAELYREENDLYGTEETIEETVTSANPGIAGTATVKTTVVETSRVTAEETTFEDIATYTRLNQIVNNMTVDKTYEVVMIEGKLYYIYTGSVTVSEGDEHGDTTNMIPLDIQESLFAKNPELDLESGGGDLKDVSTGNPTEGYRYIGYGIDTALDISKGDESSDVVQFRLKGANGKEYYAMCIDFNTTIKDGHLYDLADLSSEDYYQQDGILTVESADKIRIIALNGYWGTADDKNSTDDVGSLDEVKTLLSVYLTAQGNLSTEEVNAIVNSLTPGQALAATQAALWKYGNINGNKKVNENNLVPNGWTEGEREWDHDKREWVRVREKTEDYTNTEYLYDALLDLANNPDTKLDKDEGVELLDAEDITATSIVVKEKIASADDEGNTSGKNIYNTDLNFTLGIEPTKLFGDLKVTVYDNEGKEVKTVILASKDTTIIGLKPDDNGMYTISDIQIAEGVSVNLNLYGTQDLGTGVYIYTSLNDTRTDSQTLVTLATGSRTVDLDISMKLEVQEPTVTKTISGQTQYGTRTDTQMQTKTDTTYRKSITTKSEQETVQTEKTESSQVYTSDVTLTRVSTSQTKEERSWTFSWMKTYAPEPVPESDDIPIPTKPSDDTPDGEADTKEDIQPQKTDNIFDRLVSLATVPRTGDLSGIWVMISGLSLGGIAFLNRKRKDEE